MTLNRRHAMGSELTPKVPNPDSRSDFIYQAIQADQQAAPQEIVTRFPPEPNGYLHIGHAKSMGLNFSVAHDFGGRCYLRFDDSNPDNESQEYVDAILRDVSWLGYVWCDARYVSDYYEQLYRYACQLIEQGLAYVDSLSADEIRTLRGTLTEPGQNSPYRARSIEENLDLFTRMRAGEFAAGTHVLRAKIDMAADNINLRDPSLYRIKQQGHYRVGDQWCIYPMYDYAHCLSDAIEGVTHSLCTLEFEDHRPLYNWILEKLLPAPRPRQLEFSRLSLAYTVLSKRKLMQLVQDSHVASWDDPRMPTLSGMRRRGFPPQALRTFCERVGITKHDAQIELGVLEGCVRDHWNTHALRRMAVLDPLRIVLSNYPADKLEQLQVPEHPQCPERGERNLAFGQVAYIEQSDFAEDPPPGFKRLTPGGEVRLRHAYVIRCDRVIKDDQGRVIELQCHVDLDTLGRPPEGRKVRGVIHWLCEQHSQPAQVRLYDTLFKDPWPDLKGDLSELINPDSLVHIEQARIESAQASSPAGEVFQFERLGYFTADTDSTPERPIYNRTVTLRDVWQKKQPKP